MTIVDTLSDHPDFRTAVKDAIRDCHSVGEVASTLIERFGIEILDSGQLECMVTDWSVTYEEYLTERRTRMQAQIAHLETDTTLNVVNLLKRTAEVIHTIGIAESGNSGSHCFPSKGVTSFLTLVDSMYRFGELTEDEYRAIRLLPPIGLAELERLDIHLGPTDLEALIKLFDDIQPSD